MISTFWHGVLDYLWCALLIAAPWLFHYNRVDVETYTTDTAAAIVATYSLFTKYELGIFRNISMKTHLLFDLILGILITASPWLLGFAGRVFLPHVIFGGISVFVSLLTRRYSPQEKPVSLHKDHVQIL